MTQGPAGLWSLAWAMASVVKGSEAKKKKMKSSFGTIMVKPWIK